jgi:DNA invertase Pin-like site-specific DNA recombinase
MLARLYLRASSVEQNANRAREMMRAFAKERGLKIAATYTENESGATLKRPELFKLINDSEEGDALLVEQVDRLSRLSDTDWSKLKAELTARRIRVVAYDLPTSWQLAKDTDEFTGRMLEALNALMLDMLAAIARKDYSDRRRRQLQGIEKAKAEKRYRGGRPENSERNGEIAAMLREGKSWVRVMKATGCARGTVAKVAARVRDEPSR